MLKKNTVYLTKHVPSFYTTLFFKLLHNRKYILQNMYDILELKISLLYKTWPYYIVQYKTLYNSPCNITGIIENICVLHNIITWHKKVLNEILYQSFTLHILQIDTVYYRTGTTLHDRNHIYLINNIDIKNLTNNTVIHLKENFCNTQLKHCKREIKLQIKKQSHIIIQNTALENT